MSFDTSKCRVLNVDTHNPPYRHSLDTTVLYRTEGERDLGVLVTSDLKVRTLY